MNLSLGYQSKLGQVYVASTNKRKQRHSRHKDIKVALFILDKIRLTEKSFKIFNWNRAQYQSKQVIEFRKYIDDIYDGHTDLWMKNAAVWAICRILATIMYLRSLAAQWDAWPIVIRAR